MKIAILGVGALGSFFGAMLARYGADVTLFVRNEAHRQAIADQGLKLQIDTGDEIVTPNVAPPSHAKASVDLVMVFSKTGATRAVLAAVPGLIGPETRLISLQNGLGNQDVLAEFAPMDHVIYGTTTTPADLIAPGRVASHGPHLSQFKAATANAQTMVMAERLATLLNAADMPSVVNADIDAVIWGKVAFNTAMNSICALYAAPAGIVASTPYLTELAIAVAMESCDVAAASGVTVDREKVRQTINMSMHDHATHKPSMVRDVEAGKITEIDALNGAVVALGDQHQVPTPLNKTMLALIKGVEAQYASGQAE